MGGGVYRAGGAVTPPRALVQVKPTYTSEALSQRIQGSVVLELTVTSEGLPSDIHIVRSLDPAGLDQQAVEAAKRWRFEPGRLGGKPVDVRVTLLLDFSIR
jgi:protein TonB